MVVTMVGQQYNTVGEKPMEGHQTKQNLTLLYFWPNVISIWEPV